MSWLEDSRMTWRDRREAEPPVPAALVPQAGAGCQETSSPPGPQGSGSITDCAPENEGPSAQPPQAAGSSGVVPSLTSTSSMFQPKETVGAMWPSSQNSICTEARPSAQPEMSRRYSTQSPSSTGPIRLWAEAVLPS